jgi:hypothetical protein
VSITIIREDGEDRWTLDHVEEESWDKPIKTTTHPVEDGSTVTDHYQQEQLQVSFSAFVSDVPPPRGFRRNIDNRSERALEFFRSLADDSALVTVVSQKRGAAESMVMDSRPYTIDQQEGIGFSLSFRRIEFAESERVDIPSSQLPSDQEPGQSSDQDLGKKSTSDESESVDEQAKANLKGSYSGDIDERLGS